MEGVVEDPGEFGRVDEFLERENRGIRREREGGEG